MHYTAGTQGGNTYRGIHQSPHSLQDISEVTHILKTTDNVMSHVSHVIDKLYLVSVESINTEKDMFFNVYYINSTNIKIFPKCKISALGRKMDACGQ